MRIAAILATVLFMLAACGGGGTGSGPKSAINSTAPAATNDQRSIVLLGHARTLENQANALFAAADNSEGNRNIWDLVSEAWSLVAQAARIRAEAATVAGNTDAVEAWTLAAAAAAGYAATAEALATGNQNSGSNTSVQIERLEFPLVGFNCPDHYGEGTDCDAYREDTFDPDNIPTYQIDALPRRTRGDDGLHMPIYHDHSQLFGIGVHDWGDNQRRIFVGADRGESISRIPTADTRGNTEIRHGTITDGVNGNELRSYLSEAIGSKVVRYETAPQVYIEGSPTADQVNWTVAAVELVNAALPPEARMTMTNSSPNEGDNYIAIAYRPYTEFQSGVGGTTWNTRGVTGGNEQILSSRIHIKESAFPSLSHRHFVTLIAHELIHAFGLGHVSPRFDTLMEGDSQQIYRAWQGFGVRIRIDPDYSCGFANCFSPVHENLADIPLPMSLLYPLDREALQVLYTALEAGDDPAAYGNWSSSSLHVAGNGSHTNFGVALRNGIAEPWAQGYLPEIDIAANAALSGSATWTGELLGLTPDAAAVAGDARVGVNLASMTGRADFTNLETWGAHAAPGAEGTGTTWLDGDLGYAIAVRGNTFRETGGDAGRLTGIFTGRSHEGAAGTLERADLTAAFGASR